MGADFSELQFAYALGVNGEFPGIYEGMGDVNQPSSEIGIEPANGLFPSAGGKGVLGAGGLPGTLWTAQSQDNWIDLSSPNGMDIGPVEFSLQPNNGPQDRVGTSTVTPSNKSLGKSPGTAFGPPGGGAATFTVFQTG